MTNPAPAGISTEPYVDGDTADLPLEFDLTCAEGLVAFAQTSTWRVPTTQCPQDLPNLWTPSAAAAGQ